MHVRLIRKSDGRELPTHQWIGDRCGKCDLGEESPWRIANGRHPELCFVVKRGVCESCGTRDIPLCFDDDLLLSGRFCSLCMKSQEKKNGDHHDTGFFREPLNDNPPPNGTSLRGSPALCGQRGCRHPHEGGKCSFCSCDEFKPGRKPGGPA